MRTLIRKAIPSMFHRRLVLQLAVFAVALSALVVRLAMLTLVEGEERLERTEARLVRQSWTPTVRGQILDRKGRVLATDRPSYAAAVDFSVLDGTWATRNGERTARMVYGERWAEADAARRAEMAAPFIERYGRHADRMFDRLAELTGTPRSEIDTRIGRVLDRVARMRESVVEARRQRLIERHLASGRGLTDAEADRLAKAADTDVVEERAAHSIVPDLADDAAFTLRRMATRRVPIYTEAELASAGVAGAEAVYVDLFPGLEIDDSTERVRPFDEIEVAIDRSTLPGPMKGEGLQRVRVTGVGWHTLGTLRSRVYGEDHDRRRTAMADDAVARDRWLTPAGVDRGRYIDGDTVGRAGVERALENDLRGLRGLRTVRLDTGRMEEFEPEPGRDVQLTIDAMLEARIRAVLEPGVGLTTVQLWHNNDGVAQGETLAGAVVVIDVDTGEILAMVSTPSPTGASRWSDDGEDEAYPSFLDPTVNRAMSVPYQPGSIVKPLVLAEAVARGRHPLGRGVVCTGHLLEDRDDVYRCWIYKRFGATHSPTGEPVRAAESIKVSCNIFYYTLGRRLGPEEIGSIYAELGVGEGFGLGVGREFTGQVGRFGGSEGSSALTPSDAIFMAMGQGPVAWTPLHAANAYAALARGGAWIPPRIVSDGRPPLASRFLRFDPAAVGEALEGLRLAANDPRGTGSTIPFETGRENTFNVPGLDVWGKTGTAQTSALSHDPDGDGPEPSRIVRSGDHAWYSVLAGPAGQGPRYSVSVLIEYGGGGGRVAGPVANQVLHALIAEGYLPGGAPGAGGGAYASEGTP